MSGVCLGRSRGAKKPGFSPEEKLEVGCESSDPQLALEMTPPQSRGRNDPTFYISRILLGPHMTSNFDETLSLTSDYYFNLIFFFLFSFSSDF